MQIEYDFTVQESPEYNFTTEDNPTYNFTPSNAINITGTSDYNDLDNKPSINGNTLGGDKTTEELGIHIPTNLSDLINDDGYLKVTDLGVIDGNQYDWDVETFLNTLQETGSYIFLWGEFKYWVDIEALEVDGTTTVEQIYWGTGGGSSPTYYRNLIIENGEVIDSYVTSYMTSDVAYNTFAPQNHYHFRTDSKAVSVWDYCDGSQIRMYNGSPILYTDITDILNNKHYVIETWRTIRQPIRTIQKVTDLNDPSYFCQRSSYYSFGTEHWGNWYKFSGEVFTPPTGR